VDKVKDAFLEAECFHRAANFILEKDTVAEYEGLYKSAGMAVVIFVNHAFATEMYLKCLQLITNGNHNGGHHLGKLFDCLKKPIQKKISDRYEKVYQKDDEDLLSDTKLSLKELLPSTGDYFSSARYSFARKHSDKRTRYRLYIGSSAIKDIILEYHPDLIQESFK